MIRKAFMWTIVLTLGFVMTGCKTTEAVMKMPPMVDDGFLKNYTVPKPPTDAQTYSDLSSDEKEFYWQDYTKDLLGIIGKHQADKNGIKLWKQGVQKAYEDYRKAIGAE